MFVEEQEREGDSPTVASFGGPKRQQQHLPTLACTKTNDGPRFLRTAVGQRPCLLSPLLLLLLRVRFTAFPTPSRHSS